MAKSVKTRRGKRKRQSNLVMILREVLRRKTGLFGLSVIIFFSIIAIIGPYISPYPGDLLYRVHPDFSAPEWTKYFDPNYFPDTQFIYTNFQESSSLNDWSFHMKTNQTRFSYDYGLDTEGNKDPGSMYLKWVDNATTLHSLIEKDRTFIYAEYNYTWPYNARPADVFIYFSLKMHLEGYKESDLGRNVSIKFYVAMIREDQTPRDLINTFSDKVTPLGVKVYEVGAFSIDKYYDYKVDMEPLSIGAFFKKGVMTHIRFVMEIKILDHPEKLGSVKINLDNINGIAFSKYFGLLGTQDTGADLLSLMLYGARISLSLSISATLISAGIGIALGLFSGYYGGVIDEFIQRVIDFLIILPGLPILLVFAWILGGGFTTLLMLFALFGWTGTARLIRTQVLSEKEKPYVLSAQALGVHDIIIMFKHILPNVMPIVFVQVTTAVTGYILSEAGLSFLGFPPASVTWGKILYDVFAAGAIGIGAWWALLFPGLAIALLGTAFIYLGNALDEVLNPRLRTRG